MPLKDSPTEFGWILKDGRYWMIFFTGEQMPDPTENAIDDLTDDVDSNIINNNSDK